MAEVKGMKVFRKRLRAGFTILESLIMLVVLAILTLLFAGLIKSGMGGEEAEGAGVEAKVGVEG
jgi:type II secretory pathway pseudopilin PulG